jgi:MFS family permease
MLTLHSVSGDATLPWSSFIFTGALAFTFMVMVYVMPTRLPFLLGERGVSNPFVVAIVMSTATVFSLPGSLLYGSIRKKLSPQTVFAIAWTLMGSGMLLVALSPVFPLTIVGVAIIGLGIGPSLPNYTTYWLSIVPPTLRGRAAGMLTTALFAGQFASPLVSAPLVSLFGLDGSFAALALLQLVLSATLFSMRLRNDQQTTVI